MLSVHLSGHVDEERAGLHLQRAFAQPMLAQHVLQADLAEGGVGRVPPTVSDVTSNATHRKDQ